MLTEQANLTFPLIDRCKRNRGKTSRGRKKAGENEEKRFSDGHCARTVNRNNLAVNDRLPGPAGPQVVQISQNHLTCLVFKRRLRETDQEGPGESESDANRFLNVADEIRNLYRRSIR